MIGDLDGVVIGIGAHVFRKHRSVFETGTWKLTAACDIALERGASIANEFDCAFYADYRDVVKHARADVAILLTPHPLHAPVAIAFLEAGYHVLVEKPAAADVGQLDRMIDAAGANERLLAVCLQHRVRPEVAMARQLIAGGRLGVLQRASVKGAWPRLARYYASSPWRGTWAGEGGGVVLNQGIHPIDVLCLLLGSPSRVMSWARRRMHDTETEDTMVGLLEWDSGCVGIADFTTASAEGFLTFDLVGTRGKLRITDGALAFEEYATDVREYLLNEDGPEFRPGCVQRIGPFPKVAGHVALYENLRDAILRGTRLIADGVSVRGSLEVANALILSSATDRAVEMPLDCAEYEEFLGRMRGQEPIQDRPAKRSNGGSQ